MTAWWLAALSACTGGSGPGPGVDSAVPDAEVEPDAGPGLPDAAIDSGPDAAVQPEGPGLTGVLVDEEGQPLGGERVLACMTNVCYFAESEADGRFLFEIDPPASGALKTIEDEDGDPRRAAALEPFAILDGTLVDAGRLLAPRLPEGTPLALGDDQQTIVAGALELTLRPADLAPHPGGDLYDVAACPIPAEHVPAYSALGDEEVLAVFALHPFAATSSSPIRVRASLPLPAGTAVHVRTINEIDGTFSAPIPGRSDGVLVSTDEGLGIDELTYLVISRP